MDKIFAELIKTRSERDEWKKDAENLASALDDAKSLILNHHIAGYRIPGHDCEQCSDNDIHRIDSAIIDHWRLTINKRRLVTG